MKLHLDRSAVRFLITGYGPDHVLVNGVRHETSLIILPDELVADWPGNWSSLSSPDFDAVALRAPEILLLGTGPSQRFPAPAVYRHLIAARIGVEIMNTPAACRTYNILAGEGRRVAAALLLNP
ncbi:MAG: Mth938-like domain-containing protein [Pseudomonadota bacterium]